jgi:transcriptional regulator with XRE-family HTH domain
MIKNDKQYQVTKSRLKEFCVMLNDIRENDAQVDPLYQKMEENAVLSQIIRFKKEIEDYEILKSGATIYISIDSLPNLYEALIKGRIIRGWTQAELAKQLNLKEQQIQRYELSNYETASISKIYEIASVLDIDIKDLKIKVKEHEFLVPEGYDHNMILVAQKNLKEKRLWAL